MSDVRRITLDEVVRHFEELEDPHSAVDRKHPLPSVVVIAVMAVLALAGGPTAIARWAALKEEFLVAGRCREGQVPLDRLTVEYPFTKRMGVNNLG